VNLSQFDRIIIMPTLAAARPAVASASPAPVFQQTPQFQQQIQADDDPDDQRPAPGAVPMPNRGPVFNTFPQPQVVNPQTGQPVAFPGQVTGGVVPQQAQPAQPPVNSAAPTSPYGGVAVPGMVVQPPQQPGQAQPGAIQQPGVIQQPGAQPVRRPGGDR